MPECRVRSNFLGCLLPLFLFVLFSCLPLGPKGGQGLSILETLLPCHINTEASSEVPAVLLVGGLVEQGQWDRNWHHTPRRAGPEGTTEMWALASPAC